MDIAKEIALFRYVSESLGKPFKWGTCDCNVFALEAIDATYGTSLAEKIRGKYENDLGAVRFRLKSEWGSFEGLLKQEGFIEGKKGFEQTGDLLIVDGIGFEMVHVYLGMTVASVPIEMNVQTAPFAAMKQLDYRVWRKP